MCEILYIYENSVFTFSDKKDSFYLEIFLSDNENL